MIVVGAPGDFGGPHIGSAYIYIHSGTTWTQQAKLMADDGVGGDRFGVTVAVDGDTVVVGAYKNDGKGSVYIYACSGTTWTVQEKLMANDGAQDDWFGHNVAINGDKLAVGAPGVEYTDTPGNGSTYMFIRLGAIWTEQAKLTASDGAAGDQFGRSVAIAGDTIVVGANWDDDNDDRQWICLCFHSHRNHLDRASQTDCQ